MIQGKHYRISILTEGLLRLEYSKKDDFIDEMTQIVANRSFPKIDYETWESDGILHIQTSRVHLLYDKKEFSGTGLKIYVSSSYGDGTSSSLWHYGDEVLDLRGTYRTLDGADGEVELDHGILSRNGFGIIDDSQSVIIDHNQKVGNGQPFFKYREDEEGIDLYFFGYGNDYLEALFDFYELTGKQALLPRYALGNWWSRYYPYTDESYLRLMDKFEAEKIPLTVSVLDMDWHITKVDSKYGTGWTGYTWNREYFREPKKFLSQLHDRGLKVTLNVHPADGIRGFEDVYPQVAEHLGLDKKKEEAAVFNITDEKFVEAYFKYVHHPLEAEGNDFWWIDWQQGTNSGLKNLDPLWVLNHLHYHDSCRNNQRGLILSRYAGPGSHRYPLGFSGDSIISWKSLDFQPFFTATASNIGYSHWSHDIGGHMNGIKDDELFTRWVQLGVFSPILRLHSTNNEFNSKEPWNYSREACDIVKQYLRLRHQFIPYLYTYNVKAHLTNLPLVRPMYYYSPHLQEAYEVRNEYYFGDDMIVCPMTSKVDEESRLAKFKGWLPKGKWIDWMSGRAYQGGRRIDFYRDMESLPVLMREGSILPLDANEESNLISHPEHIILNVFLGKEGEFTLLEDEHEYARYEDADFGKTKYEIVYEQEIPILHIHPTCGNLAAVPSKRTYDIYFYGVAGGICQYKDRQMALRKDATKVNVSLLKGLEVNSKEGIHLIISMDKGVEDKRLELIFDILMNAHIEYDLKTKIMNVVNKLKENQDLLSVIGELHTLEMNESLKGALMEVLTA